jgi:predicted kinase
MSKPTLIAFVGLPRSGKSTICADLSKRLGAPIVRRDAIRLAIHGQRYEPLAEPLVKAFDLYMIRSLFLAGHEVVICDETNYSKAARNHMRDEAWETIFYHVGTSPTTCVTRAYLTNQPDLAPVIEEMYKRWEPFEFTDRIVVDVTEKGTIVDKLYEGEATNTTIETPRPLICDPEHYPEDIQFT